MSDVTRRSFLEHTLAAATVGLAAGKVVAGTDVPKSGAEAPTTRPSAKVSKNDKIGIAVIGLHGRGQNHIDAYTFDDRVEVVALCDVDEHQFAKAQQRLAERSRPVAKTYQDIRKLLEDKDV